MPSEILRSLSECSLVKHWNPCWLKTWNEIIICEMTKKSGTTVLLPWEGYNNIFMFCLRFLFLRECVTTSMSCKGRDHFNWLWLLWGFGYLHHSLQVIFWDAFVSVVVGKGIVDKKPWMILFQKRQTGVSKVVFPFKNFGCKAGCRHVVVKVWV